MEEFLGLAQEGGADGLQAAAALHRGDFLEGFYDEWIVNGRYRPEKPICRDIGAIDGRAMGTWIDYKDKNGFSYYHIVGHGKGGY